MNSMNKTEGDLQNELQRIYELIPDIAFRLGLIWKGKLEEKGKQNKLKFSTLRFGWRWANACIDLYIAVDDIGEYCIVEGDLIRHRVLYQNDSLYWPQHLLAQLIHQADNMILTALPGITHGSSLFRCEMINHTHTSTDSAHCHLYDDIWICETCKSYLAKHTIQLPHATHINGVGNNRQVKRKAERAKMSTKLRILILERDNFTCQACGRNPRNHGIDLHVDHIMPIAKDGITTPNNLQALCSDCNSGKSDNVIDQMFLWNEGGI